jgi:phenylalanyl-tRNA synthetase beta chain
MKFSYNWLQTYFETPLPKPEELAEEITFHSSEIEEVIDLGHDVVLDVKVLPDKSAWLMSHRGLAKEISVMLGLPLKEDVFVTGEKLALTGDSIKIKLETPSCDFYGAALVKGVKVGPSPEWVKERLEAIGQRSINNIVDATNYVMFETGQPLHAFDADKFDGALSVLVRQAKEGEKFTTLSNEELTLDTNDAVITHGETTEVLALAGVKGGLYAGVTVDTTNILFESAHFDRVAVRKTARKHKLQTDAAKRYENGLSALVAPIALKRVVDLVLEIAGGELSESAAVGELKVITGSVSVTLTKINSVLGLNLVRGDIENILNKFGYDYQINDDVITVVPPFERDDLLIAEDLIDEIGRMNGLDKIVSIAPKQLPLEEYNARHYYAEKIRTALVQLGFSEIYTSSFRNKDIVKLESALAADKGYLRSSLVENIKEARVNNIPHRDLLGLSAVKIFEIGTVFMENSEEFRVALAVQSGTSYKAKIDDVLLNEGIQAINEACAVEVKPLYQAEGVMEFSLEALLSEAAPVTAYEAAPAKSPVSYKAFSIYPSVSRDVAMWVGEGESVEKVSGLILTSAGGLCVRLTHLDTFTKEGKTSLAFRLVFQASDRTLTDVEIEPVMNRVYEAIKNNGFEPR